MTLDDLDIFKLSLKLGEDIWRIVVIWDYFAKDTIGKQLIRASDSVAANISEGYGRFHFKDEMRFLLYARGSLHETRTFIIIAHSRKLVSDQNFSDIISQIDILGKKLNSFINSINKKLDH